MTNPDDSNTGGQRPARIVTETVFFPAAALYGALALPLSVYGMLGGSPVPPGLGSPAGHAHELFFGYALAVVTGFLINRIERPRLLLLIGLWLAARISYLAAPGSLAALAANAGFALAVAAIAAPRFMKAAKKWRNRVIGPLVIAICIAAAVFQFTSLSDAGFVQAIVLAEAVVLFATLMLFFGGRLIAPAAAGAIERAGGRLEARVQPRIEGALLIVMAATAVLTAIPGQRAVAGIFLALAGLLALVRLARWRLWLCRRRIDLLCLGIGYAWLGIGLLLMGISAWLGAGPEIAAATHAVTIGALGTLTTNVMARTRLLRIRIAPESMAPWLLWMTTAVAAAALIRVFGDGSPGTLAMAAAAWSLAPGALFVLLLRYRSRASQPG